MPARGPRFVGWAAAALVVGSAWATPARAADEEDGGPWCKQTIAPAASLGGGYGRDVLTLGFTAGFDYYLLDGFSLGLTLGDEIFVYSNDLRGRLPSVQDQAPTNIFRATAVGRFVFYRSRRFSPFVFGGLGPSLLDNGNGTFGHWVAGPGAYIHLAGSIYLDLGMNFTGMFPVERCDSAFEVAPAGGAPVRWVADQCAFRWGPRLGIVASFDLGRKRHRRRAIPPPPS